MRSAFTQAAGLDDVVRRAEELSVRTMVFDIEPLVAHWDGGQDALDQGIARVLSAVTVLPALQVLCFATNSLRRPSVVPEEPRVQVVYLASAGKPFRTAPYRAFPRPGMVIGDQIPTDGILARRLGYAFVLVGPHLGGIPLGPRLMGAGGWLVRPFLFTRAGPGSRSR
jgi:predicted HAD superfamily phosphohydrolase YqeG